VIALGLVAAMALAALFAGCPSGRHAPPSDLVEDPREILALATRGDDGLRSVAIEARATQYSDHRVIKGKLVILVRRPAAVHFSGLSPTDDVVSVLATDGDRFTSFERGADVCFVGRACPENVGRLVPIAMESEQLAAVLVGRPPFIAHTRSKVGWDARVGAYRLELEGGDVVQRAWIAHGTGEVRRAQLIRGDRVTVDLTYGDWREIDGHRLPQRVDVRMDRDNVDLRMVYREIDVNLELADSAFAIPCPEGMEVEVLPCFDDPPGGP